MRKPAMAWRPVRQMLHPLAALALTWSASDMTPVNDPVVPLLESVMLFAMSRVTSPP